MNCAAFKFTRLKSAIAPLAVLAAASGLLKAAGPATPIKHLVIIFQENVSFDHYFATYPNATNPAGEPSFHAAQGTPSVNGLTWASLHNNPNLSNPIRLDRSQALTCDQDHGYTDEQKAFDHGLMDKFVQSVAGGGCTDKTLVMDYFDGNTITAIWNYAQRYAMSDNSFGTTFGPSTPGALNLIAGQTRGAASSYPGAPIANGTLYSDIDPTYDDCSAAHTASMTGMNVGDLLNANGVSWGWFEGGFRPTGNVGGKAVCGSAHTNIGGSSVTDYIPHHQPFQYYTSTSNPRHLPPTSAANIGLTDQANHQYDLSDFFTAMAAGNMPAVTFLKASAYQDGHAGYSDPLDEQTFLVNTINTIQKSPFWRDTAILILYDDSDGWYDHVMGPIVMQSNTTQDALTDTGMCGTAPAGAYLDRCGYGPRLPFLVISPFAKRNFVDHSVTDQSSPLAFIEDNWGLGRLGDQSTDAIAGSILNLFDFTSNGDGNSRGGSVLILDPSTGEQAPGDGDGDGNSQQ